MSQYDMLLGRTIEDIDFVNDRGGYLVEMILTMKNGDQYKFYHQHECSESVFIEDIIGDLDTITGIPLRMAEEVIYKNETPEWVNRDPYYPYRWTFYKFATIKGYVIIRWLGQSNGRCSMDVRFAEKKVGDRWCHYDRGVKIQTHIIEETAKIWWQGGVFIRVSLPDGKTKWKARGYQQWISPSSLLWDQLEDAYTRLETANA